MLVVGGCVVAIGAMVVATGFAVVGAMRLSCRARSIGLSSSLSTRTSTLASPFSVKPNFTAAA